MKPRRYALVAMEHCCDQQVEKLSSRKIVDTGGMDVQHFKFLMVPTLK